MRSTSNRNARTSARNERASPSLRGTAVLQNVDFTAWAGEVHALVGETERAKSTLMKILNGVLPARCRIAAHRWRGGADPQPARRHTAGIQHDLPGAHAGRLPHGGAEHLPRHGPMRAPGIIDNARDEPPRARGAGFARLPIARIDRGAAPHPRPKNRWWKSARALSERQPRGG